MLPRLRGRFLVRWIPAFAGITQFSRGTMILPSSRGPQGRGDPAFVDTAGTCALWVFWIASRRRVYALWVLAVAMTKNE